MRSIADTAAAGWPLAATLAMALVGERLRAGRRRTALNRALHEVRRPLQALAVSFPVPHAAAGGVPAPLELAINALADLDREINGGGVEVGARPVSCQELVGAAVGRWRARARLGGGSIAMRWGANGAVVMADPARLSQALDNLIVNALEHGGPNVVVGGRAGEGRLRISVADDGMSARHSSRSGSPAEVIARLTGRRRRGYGLAVVREVAAIHGGRFALHRSEQGSLALLELPLADRGNAMAA